MPLASITLLLGLAVIIYGVSQAHKYLQARHAPTPHRLVEILHDPKEASVILLVQLAVMSGNITPGHKGVIKQLVMHNWAQSEEEAEGLFSFGQMAVGQLTDIPGSLKKLLTPVKAQFTLVEMKTLLSMMEQVATLAGQQTSEQRNLIADTARLLKLSYEGNQSYEDNQ